MRVIAGKWRGFKIASPPENRTRPILDKVKGAVFNILGAKLARPGEIPPGNVLDLFAGTGSLGLEALSRGANYCLFVEQHRPTALLLKGTLQKLEALEQSSCLIADIWKLNFAHIANTKLFDIVFIDPPFPMTSSLSPSGPIADLMKKLTSSNVLSAAAYLILRHPKRTPCQADTFSDCRLDDQRTYGEMTISFLRPAGYICP